jgi:hypothetical protein
MIYRPPSVFPETSPVTLPLVANAASDTAAEPRRFGIVASCVVTGAILAAVGSQFENPLLDPGIETLLPAVEQVEAATPSRSRSAATTRSPRFSAACS